MEKLDLFQVHLQPNANGFMTLSESMESRSSELIEKVTHESGAPTEAIASSIFMRRFGFFITAQLYLLAHQQMWAGPFSEVHLTEAEYGIAFELDGKWLRPRQEGDLEMVLKEYAAPVVETFRKIGPISKLILWENIWGYAIWMYGMEQSVQAKQDMQALLDDTFWQPEMRKSHFKQFLGGHSLEHSQKQYKRITCCLYKELPETDKCPYCPLQK